MDRGHKLNADASLERWGIVPETGNAADYPLIYARCDYQLVDVHMSAVLSHTYQCLSSSASDVSYCFPLPPNASVHDFRAVIDQEHVITGVVKEKGEAKAEYQHAVNRGKTAALLQQENVEIFKIMLGNVKPFQTIEVHIAFVHTIAHNGSLDSLRLTFPTVIAPRYGAAPSGAAQGIHHQSGLDFTVAVEMTSQITSIASPSQHPIVWQFGYSSPTQTEEWNAHKARVSLSSTIFLDKDIVLVLSCQGLDKPRCVQESFSPEEGAQEYTDAYALTFVPRFNLPALPRQEFVFLVDRSGSMDGAKMTAVQSSLQIMLRSLPSRGTSFNIVSFGSFSNTLWPKSVPYTAEAVREASAHVDSMTANFGGTEMKNALLAAFSSRAAQGTEDVPTSVFVLTDGQSHDLDGVRAAISQTISSTKSLAKTQKMFLRVFCMGIGDAVSRAMCEAIARTGNGTSVFVGETEKPDQKLMGLLRAASGPPVENLTIDWGVNEPENSGEDDEDSDEFELISESDITLDEGADAPVSFFDENSPAAPESGPTGPREEEPTPVPVIQQAPAGPVLPPIYPGFRTEFFAIVKRANDGNSAPSRSVRISGTVLGAPVQLDVPVQSVARLQPSNVFTPVKMVHLLAARALIQNFDNKSPVTHADKAQILRLALRYDLASSQSSFVAVDQTSHQELAEYNDYSYAQPYQAHVGLRPYQPRTQQHQPMSFAPISPAAQFAQFSPAVSPSPLQFPAARIETDSHPSIQRYLAGPETMSPTSSQLPAYSLGSPGVAYGGLKDSALGISGFDAPPSPTYVAQSAPTEPYGGGFQPFIPTFGGKLDGNVHPSAGQAQGLPPMLSFAKRGFMGKRAALSVPQPSPPVILPQRASTIESVSPPATSPAAFGPRRRSSLGAPTRPLGPPVPPPMVQRPSLTEALAREQAFDGSFTASAKVFDITTKQEHAPKMPASLEALTLDVGRKTSVWATLLCVAFMHGKLVGERDVWGIMCEKAVEWVREALEGTDLQGRNVEVVMEEWKQAAGKFVR